jgi:hypothetical protein
MALALDLAEPPHTMGARQYWEHQWERPYHWLGLLFGIGMLTWCLIFKKHERHIAIAGWILVIVALLIATDVPLVN